MTSAIDPVRTQARRLCVDAGAGSGKTTVLIGRIVNLLKERLADLDEIVAITFTEAAATEMKVRLRQEFRKIAPADNPAEMSRWREMERRVDSARVTTIHAFCAGLIRQNALRLGRDPDFAVLAEAESVLLRNELIEETLHAMLEAEADDGDGPATRAAGELGVSRLSREMNRLLNHRRLVDLVKQDGLPEDPRALQEYWLAKVTDARNRLMLGLKESRELKRFRNQLEDLEGSCIKKADAREAARLYMISAIDRIFGSDDPAEIRAVLVGINGLGFRGARSSNWREGDYEVVQAVQKAVCEFVEKQIPPEIDPETEAHAAQLACDLLRVYNTLARAYDKAKIDRAGADFDDLIESAYKMLRDNDEVCRSVARGIKFMLIDEFQDTDSWQLQIARRLSDCEGGPDLFIVGDAKQSIYDFRGAEVEVFQHQRAEALTTVLGNNYRTVPDVLEFVNETFARSDLLQAVEPGYRGLAPKRAVVGEPRVEFLIPTLPEEKSLINAVRELEAEMIAARLESMVRGNAPALIETKSGEKRPATFGDAAILLRAMTNAYLYEEPLRRLGIPYNVVAGRGFYDRQEIIDLRNLLCVLVDPWNEMALLGFLRGPIAALSDEALVMLSGHGGLFAAFYSEAALPGSENEALAHARALVADLRARLTMPLPAFLRYLLDATGYEAIALSQFLGVQKAYNVRKVIDLANDFARAGAATPEAFLRYLEQAAMEETREGDAALQAEGAGAVTIMSIHKSKGLEFPIVVLADMARQQRAGGREHIVSLHRTLGLGVRVTDAFGESATPAICDAIRREQAAKDDAEQARMLYVAMTRARDRLLLCGSPNEAKGSWMQTFNDLYGVCEKPHMGMVKSACGAWSAVVRRKADEPPSPLADRSPVTDLRPEEAAWETVSLRANPVPPSPKGRRTFSVGEVLNYITEAEDREESAPPGSVHSASEAAYRGTLVHRMFELWDFHSEAPVQTVLEAEHLNSAEQDRFRQTLHEVAARFHDSPLMETMRAGRISRELDFHLQIGGALVHGVIDAVLEDVGILVDYKTGRPGGASSERYELQLRLYAHALERLTGAAPRQALLYYADCGEVHPVDVSPSAISDVVARAEAALRVLAG